MKKLFLIPVILVVGLGLTRSFQPGLFPSLLTGVQSVFGHVPHCLFEFLICHIFMHALFLPNS